MHSKHLGKNFGKNSRGNTRTNSGNQLHPNLGRPTNSTSSDRRAPPSSHRLASALLQHRLLLLFLLRPPTIPKGSSWLSGGEETRRKGEERGEERRRRGHVRWGRGKSGKLHSSPFLSTNHKQAPNFLQPSPHDHTKQHQGARNKTTKDTQTPTHNNNNKE